MSDLYQWRKRLPPMRIPASHAENEECEGAGGSNRGSLTPKKKLKPKLSSYFSHHHTTLHHVKSEPNIVIVASPDSTQSSPTSAHEFTKPHQPEAEQLMDSLASKLMATELQCLGPSDGSSVLAIIEAYRNLLDRNLRLQETANSEKLQRRRAETKLLRAQQSWANEREAYKAEVKRLELLISSGKSGVAAVIQSRHNSILRSKVKSHQRSDFMDDEDGKETVLEFLERTRVQNENTETAATVRPPHVNDDSAREVTETSLIQAVSPSLSMRYLSEELAADSTHNSALVGTPPSSILAQTLLIPSVIEVVNESFEMIDPPASLCRPSQGSFAGSSNYSTFSSKGDALSDEELDDTIVGRPAAPGSINKKDYVDVQSDDAQSNIAPVKGNTGGRRVTSDVSVLASVDEIDQQGMHDPPMTSITGPQALPDTSNGRSAGRDARPVRRFSFDYGDDSAFHSLSTDGSTSRLKTARLLRRSQSTMDHVPITKHIDSQVVLNAPPCTTSGHLLDPGQDTFSEETCSSVKSLTSRTRSIGLATAAAITAVSLRGQLG